jgi:acyl-CoA synthetase (AMP-forming)/AMP-acid ligase II
MILRGGEHLARRDRAGADLLADDRRVCFGVDDDKYGEVPAAAVKLNQDAEPSELIKHCRERLAAYKVPVTVYVLPEIPRTPTGKVQRRRVGESIVGSKAAG